MPIPLVTTSLMHDWPRPEAAFLFLDFDGTLVDIASTPDGICVPPDLPDLLAGLWHRTDGRACVVSGRSVDDLAQYLPDFPGDLYGGHGAQARIAGDMRDHHLAGSPAILQYQAAIRDFVADHAGTLAEMKAAGAVLHFRNAPDLAAEATRFAEQLVEDDPDMVAHPAKMAMELKPADVDKGGVVSSLLRDGVTPLFCGDDTTDEAGFAVVNTAGGHSIKVGEGETQARWRVPDPATMRRVLKDWLAGGTQ